MPFDQASVNLSVFAINFEKGSIILLQLHLKVRGFKINHCRLQEQKAQIR